MPIPHLATKFFNKCHVDTEIDAHLILAILASLTFGTFAAVLQYLQWLEKQHWRSLQQTFLAILR